jgi:hypothetical protein
VHSNRDEVSSLVALAPTHQGSGIPAKDWDPSAFELIGDGIGIEEAVPQIVWIRSRGRCGSWRSWREEPVIALAKIVRFESSHQIETPAR